MGFTPPTRYIATLHNTETVLRAAVPPFHALGALGLDDQVLAHELDPPVVQLDRSLPAAGVDDLAGDPPQKDALTADQ